MSLREEMWKYEQITGESAEHVPIIKIGAFLDGYEMGLKALEQEPKMQDCEHCSHSEEQDGSNCYECVKGMADNFEAQPSLNKLDDIITKAIDESENQIECQTLRWVLDEMSELPSVTPQQLSVTDFADKCKECGKILNDKLQTKWIPIKTRPMTEEEKEEIGYEYAYMYDCPLPDDGQDVLITDCYGNIEVDTFCRDCLGVYFENNCDDGEVIAWMSLPQPYKAESEVQ